MGFDALLVLSLTDVSAITTKSLKVDFNTVVDTEGVTYSVKRGSTVVVLEPTYSEDKKSVVLSSAVALTAGDYTVTVNGGKFEAGTNVGTVTVAPEKETTLSITSDTVSKSAAGVIAFEIKNQYGEVMSVSGTAVTATAYDRTDTAPTTGAVGSVTLTGTAGKSELTGDFSVAGVANNDEVLVTVNYKGLTASKVVTAKSLPSISSLTLGSVVPNTDKVRVTSGETVELKYTAVDQYGKEIKLPAGNGTGTDDKEMLATDYQLTSSNPAVVDVDAISVDVDGKLTIVAGAKGTAKLTLVNVKTGAVSTSDVEVFNTSAADSISLTAPSKLTAVGEDVKVAYTVVDQFGATIKPADLNVGQVVLSSSNNSIATVAWVGKEIVVTGTGAGTAEISATIGTKVVKFSIDIQPEAVATKVVGVKDVATLYENTATSVLDFSDILVKDQYGRDYTLEDGDVVTVVAKDGTENGVTKSLSDAAFDATADTVTFTGTADTSNEVFTIAINGVTGSGYDLTLASVASAAITSYELKSVGTLYGTALNDATSAHAADLTLVGKNAAGKEVALVSTKITNLTSSDSSVIDVDFATKKVFALGKGEATITAWNGATKLATLTVAASDVAPKLTSVSFASDSVSKLATDPDFTNAITLKDQYGVAITATGTYSSSNETVATVSGAGLVNVLAAGTTTIGFVGANGVSQTYTLTVQ